MMRVLTVVAMVGGGCDVVITVVVMVGDGE